MQNSGKPIKFHVHSMNFQLAPFQLGPGLKLKAANRHWTSWKVPEVQGGSVETNLLFYFSDPCCEHLLLSERSLGGCIGFGGSAQAGESSKHCFVLGLADL